MIDGIELTRVFERQAPDGSTFLTGVLGDTVVAIVRDPTRTGTWRVILSDPSRVNNRTSELTRAIAAPVDGWYTADMDDDINHEWLTSQQPGEDH
jgi:hypothetical protein